MNRVVPVARILLGLVFLVFGLNYFLHFLPEPKAAMPVPLQQLMAGLVASKLMGLVKIIEVVAGAALLANRAVPLALLLLAPIIVGINVLHATLAPEGLPVAIGVLVLELVVAYGYRRVFMPIVQLEVAR